MWSGEQFLRYAFYMSTRLKQYLPSDKKGEVYSHLDLIDFDLRSLPFRRESHTVSNA